MKIKFTLLTLLVLFSFAAGAQELTGIWRGYFMSGSNFFPERYRYEIQIFKNPDNSVFGVTYSYKNTDFYAKVNCTGMFNSKSKNIVVKETTTIDIKIAANVEQCNMTCYLTYSRQGNMEVLEGTFTSVTDEKRECGGGTVYLEKVATSDFKKEEFLLRVPPAVKKTPPVTLKQATKPKVDKPAIITPKKTTPAPQENDVVKKPVVPEKARIETPELTAATRDHNPTKITRARENNVIRTLKVTEGTIKIDFYDNGVVDGDTITIYHNKEVVLYKKRLTGKPLTLSIKVDSNNPWHEFVVYADNLGEIPPNTATVIVTAGNKSYELSVTSTEKKNAAFVLEYIPQPTK